MKAKPPLASSPFVPQSLSSPNDLTSPQFDSSANVPPSAAAPQPKYTFTSVPTVQFIPAAQPVIQLSF